MALKLRHATNPYNIILGHGLVSLGSSPRSSPFKGESSHEHVERQQAF